MFTIIRNIKSEFLEVSGNISAHGSIIPKNLLQDFSAVFEITRFLNLISCGSDDILPSATSLHICCGKNEGISNDFVKLTFTKLLL